MLEVVLSQVESRESMLTATGENSWRKTAGSAGDAREAVLDDHQAGPLSSTLAIAAIVFQLRVVTGTPKSRSNVLR